MTAYDGSTALLVVDVQNDFADPRGSLYVPGGDEIVGRVNEEVGRAEAGGAVVAYTQDWHPPDTPHFAKDGGPWPVHCVAGSWGAQLVAGLRVAGPVVQKGTGGEDGYSGFSVRDALGGRSPTALDGLLRGRSVARVVVVGRATDYCVKESVLDALRLGFGATVLAAAVRAVDVTAGDGLRALDEMAAAGAEVLAGPPG